MNDGDKRALAKKLAVGWARYAEFFGQPPHGTEMQLLAMLELSHLDGELKAEEHCHFAPCSNCGSDGCCPGCDPVSPMVTP